MQDKTQSIVIGGLAVGVIASIVSIVPIMLGFNTSSGPGMAIGCLACLAFMGAGLLAVWHYTDSNEVTILGGQGAGMGALAGLLASVISALITQAASFLGITPSMEEQMRRAFEANPNLDPEQAEQMIQNMQSPLVLIGTIAFSIVIGAILGTVGGAIGAAMFKKGGEPAGNLDRL